MARKAKRTADARVWYRASDPAGPLVRTTEELLILDRVRQQRYEKFFQLYGGTRLVGLRPWETPTTMYAAVVEDSPQADRLRLNVCKAAIDTITSKVGKLQPRPTFLTNGGDFGLQQKAKKLQKFIDGAYHQSDAYAIAPDVFRDAMIFGTGVLHVFGQACRMTVERCHPWELVVDPRDAMYGDPRRLYRVKWVSRDSVEDVLGEGSLDDGAVTNMSSMGGEYGVGGIGSEDGSDGFVRIIEAWHLPSPDYEPGEDGEGLPGRHVVLVGSKVVTDEDWCCREFPFVFVHWSKPVQGFWGDSAIREVVGIQVEVNALIQTVQQAMMLVGQPWVFAHDLAVIKPGQPVNGIGTVYKVEANTSLDEALRVVTFNPVPPQVMEHLWALYAKAFEVLGSNQLAASATAPAGLESGRALERLSEEHSERFMTVSRHFEYCIGEALARQFIRVAKEIDEEERAEGHREGFVIRAPGGKVTLQIAWDEVEMDEDGYLIQVFPTSVLPTTPSARIDEVQRLSDAQWIGKEQAIRLLNLPDLEADQSLATAGLDILAKQIESMLEDGEPVQPEPYQNLTECIDIAQKSILRAQCDGVPERHVDLVRDFITACETLIRSMQPAQPPQGQQSPPPGGAPAAQPPGGGGAAPPGGMPGM